MHTRVRNSDFFDRCLQLSNVERRRSVEHVVATVEALDRPPAFDHSAPAVPCRSHEPHNDDAAVKVRGTQTTVDNSPTRSGRLCTSSEQRTPPGSASGSEYCIDWFQRSCVTPSANYASLVRAASAGGGSGVSTTSAAEAALRPRHHRQHGALQRALIVPLAKGSAGLDASCSQLASSFGAGSCGLGPARLRTLRHEISTAAVRQWSDRMDKWMMEQRTVDQATVKLRAQQGRLPSVRDLQVARQVCEDQKSAVVRALKNERKRAYSEVACVREDLTRAEHQWVKAARDAEVDAEKQRALEDAEHAAALQEIARLEMMSRRIDKIRKEQTIADSVRRRQVAAAAVREAAVEQHRQASALRSAERRALAETLKKKEKKWEGAVNHAEKERLEWNKSFVRAMRRDLAEGASNAKFLLESRNAKRRDKIKKQSDELLLAKHEMEESSRNRLTAAHQAAREASESASRRRSPLSAPDDDT